MYRLIPGMAILLAYAITPASGEITENALHCMTDGHGAHAPYRCAAEAEAADPEMHAKFPAMPSPQAL
jgi:hypothetical protein